MIRVDSWGIGGSVVDAGHGGRAWLGQSRGGAVDLPSFELANRLVGNGEAAAGLETSGGLRLTVDVPMMVALTGATAVVEVVHGPPVGWGVPVVLPAGAQLRIGRLLDGARCYLAVRGGVSGRDDELTVGADPGSPAASHPAARAPLAHSIRVWPGPRRDWFETDAWALLTSSSFEVAATSRVGVRLSGPALRRVRHGELPSEGLTEGAIQVPPDGMPMIMLADHPTTGGYPVIAVVHRDDLAAAAQAAVGTRLSFRVARS